MTAVCYDPKDVCYFHPCQNGGTCSPPKANDGDKPYTCHCFLGFGGVSCEKRQGKSADWVLYEYSSGYLRWSISGGMFYVGTDYKKCSRNDFELRRFLCKKVLTDQLLGFCGVELSWEEQGSCFHFAYLFFVVFVPVWEILARALLLIAGTVKFSDVLPTHHKDWTSPKYFVGNTTSRLQSELGATRTVNFTRSKYFFQYRHHVLQFNGMTFSQSSVN